MDRDARGRFVRGKGTGSAPGDTLRGRFQPGNTLGRKFRRGNKLWTSGRKFQPGNTMGFKPGRSGNPGGRTKAHRAVLALAQDPTEAALARLAELMWCDDPRAAIAACKIILDHARDRARRAEPAAQAQTIELRWLDARDMDAADDPDRAAAGASYYDPSRDPWRASEGDR